MTVTRHRVCSGHRARGRREKRGPVRALPQRRSLLRRQARPSSQAFEAATDQMRHDRRRRCHHHPVRHRSRSATKSQIRSRSSGRRTSISPLRVLAFGRRTPRLAERRRTSPVVNSVDRRRENPRPRAGTANRSGIVVRVHHGIEAMIRGLRLDTELGRVHPSEPPRSDTDRKPGSRANHERVQVKCRKRDHVRQLARTVRATIRSDRRVIHQLLWNVSREIVARRIDERGRLITRGSILPTIRPAPAPPPPPPAAAQVTGRTMPMRVRHRTLHLVHHEAHHRALQIPGPRLAPHMKRRRRIRMDLQQRMPTVISLPPIHGPLVPLHLPRRVNVPRWTTSPDRTSPAQMGASRPLCHLLHVSDLRSSNAGVKRDYGSNGA